MTPDPLSTIKEAIAEAQKLRAEASPGPWHMAVGHIGGGSISAWRNGSRYFIADVRAQFFRYVSNGVEPEDLGVEAGANLRLIANARNVDFPAALAIAVKALGEMQYMSFARQTLEEMARALAPEVTK